MIAVRTDYDCSSLQLKGEWHTDTGTGGTFVLFPHEGMECDDRMDVSEPSQIYTARHKFGAVALDKRQIITLAEKMQSYFATSEVVVTIASGTEQTRLGLIGRFVSRSTLRRIEEGT